MGSAFLFVWLLALSVFLKFIHFAVQIKPSFLYCWVVIRRADHTSVYPFAINQRGQNLHFWQVQITLAGSGQVCVCGPLLPSLVGKRLGGW